jgi:hypothetical protein
VKERFVVVVIHKVCAPNKGVTFGSRAR